jgi:hypothetical protein
MIKKMIKIQPAVTDVVKLAAASIAATCRSMQTRAKTAFSSPSTQPITPQDIP